MVNSSDPKALQDKLQEVLADEAFVKELLNIEKPEDVQIALEKKDIELTLDEICQISEFLKKIQNGEVSQEQLQSMSDGELSEDELEEVSGGFVLTLLGILGIGFFAGGITGGAYIVSKATSW